MDRAALARCRAGVRVRVVRAGVSDGVDARAAAGVRRLDRGLGGGGRDLHRGLGLRRSVLRRARRPQPGSAADLRGARARDRAPERAHAAGCSLRCATLYICERRHAAARRGRRQRRCGSCSRGVVLAAADVPDGRHAAGGGARDRARRRLGSRRGVALLYAVNTLGAVLGALLTTFVLLEALGNRATLLDGVRCSTCWSRRGARSRAQARAPVASTTRDAPRRRRSAGAAAAAGTFAYAARS